MTASGDKLDSHPSRSDPFFADIREWLEEFQKKDDGYKDWFRIQFEKTFPDFNNWKKRREDKEGEDSKIKNRIITQ